MKADAQDISGGSGVAIRPGSSSHVNLVKNRALVAALEQRLNRQIAAAERLRAQLSIAQEAAIGHDSKHECERCGGPVPPRRVRCPHCGWRTIMQRGYAKNRTWLP